jgi:hypothetical protein
MQAASLEVLEKANVPAPQARAIVQAIENELTGARDTLATKQDLLELKMELKAEISGARTELENKITGLRAELKEGLAGLRAELKEALAGLRAEFKQDIAALRAEFKEDIASLRGDLRSEFKSDIASLRADMYALAASSNRQMYTALLGQMAVLLGIAYFFVSHLNR